MRDLAASEIRRLHRKVAGAERRLALIELPGKVLPKSQDYQTRTLRLELGKSADGRPILSPKVPWQEAAAGNFKIHSPPKDNEQMTLRSGSGTVGTGSIAESRTYDRDTESPAKSGNLAVLEHGKTRIELRADSLVVTVDGKGYELTGQELKMTTRFRAKGGSRPAHPKGGVDTDGDIAVTGNPEILV